MIDDRLKGLKEFITEKIQEWNIPGTAVGVIKNGEVIFSEGIGMRSIKEKLEVTTDTLFSIASMTKPFTSTALAILVDEGKLEWDKPIKNYMPEVKLYDEFATEHLTVRDILSHRTGLPRHDYMWEGCPFTRAEIVDRIKYLKPSKGFRTTYQYQNLMFVLGGYLIERITGKTWEEFVKERIFDQLGMDRSNFSSDESLKCSNYAHPYVNQDGELKEIEFGNKDAVGPAGTINSTIEDILKWYMLQINRGKWGNKQIVSEGNLKETHTPHTIIPKGPISFKELPYSSYGLGWFVQPYRGYNQIYHTGSIYGFGSVGAFMPDEGIGVIVLSNSEQSYMFNVAVKNTIFDRLLGAGEIDWMSRYKEVDEKMKDEVKQQNLKINAERIPGTFPSHKLEEYAGIYTHPGYGDISICVKDSSLYVDFHMHHLELKHQHYDSFLWDMNKFSAPTMVVSFGTNKEGKIDSISVPFEASVEDIVFKKTQKNAL